MWEHHHTVQQLFIRGGQHLQQQRCGNHQLVLRAVILTLTGHVFCWQQHLNHSVIRFNGKLRQHGVVVITGNVPTGLFCTVLRWVFFHGECVQQWRSYGVSRAAGDLGFGLGAGPGMHRRRQRE